ncbi:DNA replication and repair protein RecF [Thiosulfatimonas sediminis]|uniref:DNA replication and repair protein RecF n=1 Tax=Thiosulfatimonas sediminis TaxID=2675054 RepID=A0A6F8PR80_9GAMM|nr:DNA replication/repair protein RecF [Thiosulfatimonas sediminis]BBP44631.1 DNA replication and repair protein RecF [Thiosulfatimonas sediminis]
MTQLTRLQLQAFRNAEQINCQLCSGLNLFIGDNAAGKTSLIEAIWLLATGRSFRSRLIHQLIQHDKTETVIFAELQSHIKPYSNHRIGMQRSAQNMTLRLDGETIRAQSEIAQKLPVQLLTPESHRLLEEGPKARRQFVDWGCFYQFPEFIQWWRQHKRLLKQRNQALKQRLPALQIQLWDTQLVETSLQIDQLRRRYVETLTPLIETYCQALMPELEQTLGCHYRPGWPKSADSLAQLMQANLNKDLQLGHTQYGAHRADIRFRFGNYEALQTLSRGQQKLFVCALMLAQAQLHQQVTHEPAIMLIDDLPAELDLLHREKLMELLDNLQIQHLVTSTAQSLIPIINPENSQIWQLKKGKLNAL